MNKISLLLIVSLVSSTMQTQSLVNAAKDTLDYGLAMLTSHTTDLTIQLQAVDEEISTQIQNIQAIQKELQKRITEAEAGQGVYNSWRLRRQAQKLDGALQNLIAVQQQIRRTLSDLNNKQTKAAQAVSVALTETRDLLGQMAKV